jgi:hypothetical protein
MFRFLSSSFHYSYNYFLLSLSFVVLNITLNRTFGLFPSSFVFPQFSALTKLKWIVMTIPSYFFHLLSMLVSTLGASPNGLMFWIYSPDILDTNFKHSSHKYKFFSHNKIISIMSSPLKSRQEMPYKMIIWSARKMTLRSSLAVDESLRGHAHFTIMQSYQNENRYR